MHKNTIVYFKYSKRQTNWFLGFLVEPGVVSLDSNQRLRFKPSVIKTLKEFEIENGDKIKYNGSLIKIGDYAYFSNHLDFLPRHECRFRSLKKGKIECYCGQLFRHIKPSTCLGA